MEKWKEILQREKNEKNTGIEKKRIEKKKETKEKKITSQREEKGAGRKNAVIPWNSWQISTHICYWKVEKKGRN